MVFKFSLGQHLFTRDTPKTTCQRCHRCYMSDVRCQMSDVRCQMSDVRCHMPDVVYEMSYRMSQMLDTEMCLLEICFRLSCVPQKNEEFFLL